jgi:ATP-dependent Clp protease ATP-binding subunit ClpC
MIRLKGSLGFIPEKAEETYNDMKVRLLDEVKKVFKPEFLNRIDDIIVFKSLSREHLYEIVKLEIQEVANRLREREILIELTPQAMDFLISKGFDPVFGARPLKRTIQRYLEDPLAEEIIAGHYKSASRIMIDGDNDRLSFKQGESAHRS